MSRIDKEKENEMIDYVEYLLKSGIYCFGNNLHLIAAHLVNSGCRIHMSQRKLKYLNKYKNQK